MVEIPKGLGLRLIITKITNRLILFLNCDTLQLSKVLSIIQISLLLEKDLSALLPDEFDEVIIT